MTLFLPLEASTPLPNSPHFLLQSEDVAAQHLKVVKAILKAKRIVVVSGAGISVQAGIPDFRSPEGLFKSLKKDNPREALSSGKDLFDASVFNSEHTTSLFCQMIARLSELSHTAEPTAFHKLLRTLDQRGNLLRVYTQNIDAIEQKSGLSFGIPEFDGKRQRPRAKGGVSLTADDLSDEACNAEAGPSRHSSPAEIPRCIPLHGTLQNMHCQICTHSYPLEDYLDSLIAGLPPTCPECVAMEETRQLVGKRARGVGKLRPSVVLYNEDHKNGEGVGEVVQKDLMGVSKGKGRSGADLLLVVGTSLRVPGTKRMVREFAKAVRSRGSAFATGNNPPSKESPNTPSPTSSPRRSPATEEEPPLKSVYLNLEFPVPTREWDGVFDAWLQGDAQDFAKIMQEEIEREYRAKDLAEEKKRIREETAALVAQKKDSTTLDSPKPVKRKPSSQRSTTPKRPKTVGLLTPPNSQSPASRNGNFLDPTCLSVAPDDKLILRIPPRTSVKKLRPQVLIQNTPSHIYNLPSHLHDPLLTPDKSPPTRPNPRTKAGRRAARQARQMKKRNIKESRPLVNVDGFHSSDDEADVLQTSLMRNVRYHSRAPEN